MLLALHGSALSLVGLDLATHSVRTPLRHTEFFTRLTTADQDALTDAIDRARGGTPVELVVALARPDGSPALSLTIAPLQQDIDTVGYVLVSGRIGNPSGASADLSEFFDLSFDLMAIADRDLRLLRVNRQWERTLVWSTDELQSTSIWALLHPDDTALTAEALQRLLPDSPSAELEARMRRPDGAYRLIAWEIGTIGEHLHFVGRDVTQRRLLEGYLPQVQKMEAISEITGSVAHDLNNVLMAVLGFGDMALAKLEAGNPLHEDVTMMVGGARRAQGVVRQLLSLARRQPLEIRAVDLNDACRDLQRLLGPMLGRNIETSLELSVDPCHVLIDSGQLDQMLLNLATNARDAMPQGGRLILRTSHATLDPEFARVHAGARPGDYARLDVEDSGIGMADDVLAHVFEPFFTTKPAGRGTGLGLPMVYGGMKQAGGYIDVVSTPGRGSRFSLYFPRPVDAAAAGPSAAPASLTILLIEEDRSLRALIARMFETARFTLISAATPQLAREALTRDNARPDLLIADLPRLRPDERATVETIRAIVPDKPMLLLVDAEGAPSPEPAHAGRGPMLVLPKPFTREELLARLEILLAS